MNMTLGAGQVAVVLLELLEEHRQEFEGLLSKRYKQDLSVTWEAGEMELLLSLQKFGQTEGPTSEGEYTLIIKKTKAEI
jgi:hypothetical protein